MFERVPTPDLQTPDGWLPLATSRLHPCWDKLACSLLPASAACLAATLREYQLEGLRWLVQMWDAGMNAILAGEWAAVWHGVEQRRQEGHCMNHSRTHGYDDR